MNSPYKSPSTFNILIFRFALYSTLKIVHMFDEVNSFGIIVVNG